ncbi:hypothetical protein [Mycobacterium sp. D16Q16]|uniref:hypothetical protein n=1 Tax=Mycobacterium sp. D16Q16 TaxID=1855659 RepID=UPI0015927313|nr:hypothetical protein [Mycobacterium sp. D16Q16]
MGKRGLASRLHAVPVTDRLTDAPGRQSALRGAATRKANREAKKKAAAARD